MHSNKRGCSTNAGRRSTAEARTLILSDNDGIPLVSNSVDTVLTNPPFDTKRVLIRQASSWDGVEEVKVVAQMRFDLPKVYKFHKEKSVDIEVDLIRVTLVGAANHDDEEVHTETRRTDRSMFTMRRIIGRKFKFHQLSTSSRLPCRRLCCAADQKIRAVPRPSRRAGWRCRSRKRQGRCS